MRSNHRRREHWVAAHWYLLYYVLSVQPPTTPGYGASYGQSYGV